MDSHYTNVTMASDQSKILSAQKAEKKAFESLPKDVKDLTEANPAPQIIQRLWTRPDLIKQFKAEADYTEFELTIAENLISTAIMTATNGAAVTGLLETAHDFIVEKVQEDIAADVVGLVPQRKFESKAATKAVRSFGANFILMSVSLALHANPGTATVAMLFTLILYMHQKEEERQAKWNIELATILDEKLKVIRANKQQNLDKKHAKQLESFLLSDMSSTVSDETMLGSYVNNKSGRVIELSIGDAAQLATHVDGQYNSLVRPQSLLRACAWLGLVPRRNETLKLKREQKLGLNAYFGWLKQNIKDELDAEYNSSLEEESAIIAPKVEATKGGSRK